MRVIVDFLNEQEDFNITEELEKKLEKVVAYALEYEQYERSCTVCVSFVDEEQIHSLNKEFRDVDRVTDVLSFPDGTVNPEDGEVFLGDVIICTKRALEQAEEFGHSIERELSFLCAHSVLHLLGYDHETGEQDEQIMFKKQGEILENLGITR